MDIAGVSASTGLHTLDIPDSDVTPCYNLADTSWVILSAVLVLGMMPGLSFFEAGLLRSKNTVSVLSQTLGPVPFLTFMWYTVGFTLTFSGDGAFIGDFRHVLLLNLSMDTCVENAPEIPGSAFILFMTMFAVITPLLVSGAVAERMRFKPFLIYCILFELLVYYPVAHWIWGSGFLQTWGVQDFAGGITIHTTAGISALVLALYLGRRSDFMECHGEYAPSNLPLATVGGALLWVGWFGFNAGSALSATALTAQIALNTNVAASSCACTWITLHALRKEPIEIIVVLNGTIAGLAGITPASGYVTPQSAFVIGIVLGIASYGSVLLLRERWMIDDALDVSSVHGVPGVVGAIAIGFAGDSSVSGSDGLIYGGGWSLLGKQVTAVVLVAAYAAAMTGLIILFLRFTVSHDFALHQDDEHHGLDYHDHETSGYNITENSPMFEEARLRRREQNHPNAPETPPTTTSPIVTGTSINGGQMGSGQRGMGKKGGATAKSPLLG